MNNEPSTIKTSCNQQTSGENLTPTSTEPILMQSKTIEKHRTKSNKIVRSTQKLQEIEQRKPAYNLNKDVRQLDFLQAFFNNNGLILRTCDQLRIKYSTYKKWMKDPKFKEKFDIAQQRVNEIMEDSLIQKALNTNSPVPEIFYLKSRDSRYSQRVTLEGEEDRPIQVTYDKDTLSNITKAISNILTK